MTDDRVGIRIYEHDPVGQKMKSRQVVFTHEGTWLGLRAVSLSVRRGAAY